MPVLKSQYTVALTVKVGEMLDASNSGATGSTRQQKMGARGGLFIVLSIVFCFIYIEDENVVLQVGSLLCLLQLTRIVIWGLP